MRFVLPLALIVGCSHAVAAPAPTLRPRLGVIVVFDQMRATDVDRYDAFFEPGGFGGILAHGGARYDVRYSYANTETGPGHATIGTGANPSTHGIVSNYWYVGGDFMYVVGDADSPILGNPKKKGVSGRNMMAGTLGDAMKIESNGAAHVVGISLKDRAAILTTGRAADVAVWYDPDVGSFTSSKAYGDELPSWLQPLAGKLPKDSMTTGKWSPMPPPKGLEALVPDDAHPNEGGGDRGWTDRFPHDVSAQPDATRKLAYMGTPQAMRDLFTLALAAVDGEELGRDAVPDLLVVSVSTTDYTGHDFGPTSREALEMLRQCDLGLRDFIKQLDDKVGHDNYVLAVASDHASTPLPELVKAQSFPAGRVLVKPLLAAVDKAIDDAVNKKPLKKQPPVNEKTKLKWVQGFASPHLFLALDQLPPELHEVALTAARKVLEATEGIATTYVPAGRSVQGDEWAPMFEQVLFPGRSGQLLVRQQPRYIFQYDTAAGTDHGTPYNYDNRVPLLLVGPGVKPGRFSELGDVRDIAVTLAWLLRAPMPDLATGKRLNLAP